MARVVALGFERNRISRLPLQDAERVENSADLLARLRTGPGEIAWVVVAPDFELPSDLATQIRDADPTVSLVLLGPQTVYGADALEIPCARDPEPTAALRRELAYVRSLLDAIDIAALVLAPDGTIREWNRRAESLYGVSRGEALGRSYFRFLPDEERTRVRDDIRRLVAGGAPTQGFENAVRTPDGLRHIVWYAALVEDVRGEPAVLATGVDLTQRQATERILRETERRALRAERLASTNALIASIAHDVGTPMTAILGYAELIAKSVGDDKNRKRAATIVEQVNRVSHLIETLAKLSQVEGRPPRPLAIADLIDKALDLYREKLERCGIEIQRDYRTTPHVLGDPIRLHQLFLSVFLDAVEAMPDGGTLRVRVGETGSAEAEIRIQLTGTDSDAELRARIFDPRASAKPLAGGGGLGLLVAKTIVEEHEGKIELSTETGRGIELRLVLPGPSDDAR